MANKGRPASDVVALEQALQSQPYKFGFYQTLRRFECLHQDKPRIGMSVRPVDDALRLAQEPSVIFAPSTLASFKIASEHQPSTLAVHFFGMFGPNGPLPLHIYLEPIVPFTAVFPQNTEFLTSSSSPILQAPKTPP